MKGETESIDFAGSQPARVQSDGSRTSSEIALLDGQPIDQEFERAKIKTLELH